MAQDRPTADELVAAVRELLEREVQPALEGRLAFHVRVAANALGIVGRELTVGPTLEDAERARAARILGHAAPARELEAELAAGIRSGALDERGDEVLAHVRATVREKLLVANPGYLPGEPSPT